MKSLVLLNHLAASGVTLMRGVASHPAAVRPAQPLVLYEMEGCPFCRMVREAVTDLDLDVRIRPCPKGGVRFRAELRAMGGKEQFPYLIDPNTGVSMYESGDIIDYLYAAYGGRMAPSPRKLKLLRLPTSLLATKLRAGHGMFRRESNMPEQELELWSFEGSPFARPVREALCELEIPYLLHSVGRTQWQDWLPPAVRERVLPDYRPREHNRVELQARAGRVQVPYLHDPNTGEGMFESDDILAHIERHYAR